MAVDLQVAFPQQSIKVNGIKAVPGTDPEVLDVLGDDFSSVDEVLVNDVASPSYYVVSKTRMYVTLPGVVPSRDVRTVAVTSRNLVFTEQSFLRFQMSRVPSKTVGILRLVQLFVKVLFTNPGTDIFNPQLGGGVLRNIGRTFSKNQTGAIISDFVVSVDNVVRQIVAIQSRQPRLPPDEKLLSATVTSANFSMQESALLVTIEVTSQSGKSVKANVVT